MKPPSKSNSPAPNRLSRVPAFGRCGVVVLLVIVLLAPLVARAQFAVPNTVQARSHSGQFLLTTVARKPEPTAMLSNLETNHSYIRLEPTLVPVSCERIKQILWRQLGASAPWAGRVFLALYPGSYAEEPVTITSGHFRDGWQYRIELPDIIDRSRYVRTIVHVLLLEMANRTAPDHSAEIPIWFTEGLTEQLLHSNEIDILLPPPRPTSGRISMATTYVDKRLENPLEHAHQRLCASPGLTFQQLSWPSTEPLSDAQAETYRSSAQFFVSELLQLKEGRACLRAMLAELPQHYNWQFAFLKAFHTYFQRPLDIEKWWAIHLEHFTGRDLTQTWPAEESWQKLDEVIRSAVQVRAGTNDLPLHTEVKLQTIIQEWDLPIQTQALQIKLREIEMLRLRLATNFIVMADEYHQALANYLQTRDQGGFPFRKKAVRRHAAETATRRLNQLDEHRASLKPGPLDPAVIQANARRATP